MLSMISRLLLLACTPLYVLGLDRAEADRALERAVALLIRGDRAGAAAILAPLRRHAEVSTGRDMATPDDWYVLGRVLFHGNDEGALGAFDRAIAGRSDDAAFYFWRGAVHLEARRLDEALADVRRATQLESKNERYLETFADLLGRQGRLEEAHTAWLELRALAPTSAVPLIGLTTLFASRRLFAQAIPFAVAAVEIDRRNPTARANLGLLYQDLARYADAIEQYRTLIELTPDAWRPRAKLVQLYEATNDLAGRDAARAALLDVARQKRPDEPCFCREQRTITGKRVVFCEYFERGDVQFGDLTVYVAMVLDTAGVESYRITLESLNRHHRVPAPEPRDTGDRTGLDIRRLPGERARHLGPPRRRADV